MSAWRRAFVRAVLAASLVPSPALARKTETLPHPFTDVWNVAVRFVVVDEGFAITQKDAEAGYVLFTFVPPGSKKEERGALELVRQGDRTDVVVSLPGLPSHHEAVLLERFLAKVRREIRDVRPPARGGSKAAKAADAGARAGGEAP